MGGRGYVNERREAANRIKLQQGEDVFGHADYLGLGAGLCK